MKQRQMYMRPETWEALDASYSEGISYIAGGTEILPLMRAGIAHPRAVIDLAALGSNDIGLLPCGLLAIGSLARLSDVASHPLVRERVPAISQAIDLSASAQIRNMATVGGCLLQRTRCSYFRDLAFPCNKRLPGSGCPAIDGEGRHHALFGASEHCVAVHPSDLAVALSVLDATVQLRSIGGDRRAVPIGEFYCSADAAFSSETVLRPGETIARIDLPMTPQVRRSCYAKLRDRASFDFALVSVAVALRMSSGRIDEVHIAVGGMAPRPWRLHDVETRLGGCDVSPDSIDAAFCGFERDARPLKDNRFKIDLIRRLAVRTIADLGRTGRPR